LPLFLQRVNAIDTGMRIQSRLSQRIQLLIETGNIRLELAPKRSLHDLVNNLFVGKEILNQGAAGARGAAGAALDAAQHLIVPGNGRDLIGTIGIHPGSEACLRQCLPLFHSARSLN
jgi:hypothetical protein